MTRYDLPRSMLRRIDERALDEAVRRFPIVLKMARASGFGDDPLPGWIAVMSDVTRDLIIREYHLVVAERDKSATLALR
jgi:hypothetical protein